MSVSTLLFICALGLSGTAAYYSIIGLATIFASAFWPVVIMAGILEISKLVVASWLYQKWDTVPRLLRSYLTAAVIVLMLITSLGIFGFLSKAHVEQGLRNTEISLRIEQIDSQINQARATIQRYESQLQQLDRSINIQLDNNRAQQALVARRQQEAERSQIRTRLDAEQQVLQELNRRKIDLRQQISVLESELGPIRYVAEFFYPDSQIDMEKAVRWIIVVIVLVFDPLAVLMIIAANMSLIRERRKDPTPEVSNSTSLVPAPAPIDHIAIATAVAAAIAHTMDGRSREMQQPYPDKDAIESAVRNAMDTWLTEAATGQQANDSDGQADTASEPKDTSDLAPAVQGGNDQVTGPQNPLPIAPVDQSVTGPTGPTGPIDPKITTWL